ncbi:hypothetical protein EJ05DRAFT_345037 [Pseudovirgaria hyperparasitica]|uniref:Uncharacterized protein n=1 Tax=Pseudovirgaria hyperparasitica TaxID=470096 RepID=A0A6A6WBR8_9PEZI|nr:uncharacterized protein EJ05DRAFT_345037 [Pseudovirgaria hyperparasitica]KAF2759410.1 hypothetical protein EJ05DRAFT_345037 [Pseudovirgaria hyperparasitica]
MLVGLSIANKRITAHSRCSPTTDRSVLIFPRYTHPPPPKAAPARAAFPATSLFAFAALPPLPITLSSSATSPCASAFKTTKRLFLFLSLSHSLSPPRAFLSLSSIPPVTSQPLLSSRQFVLQNRPASRHLRRLIQSCRLEICIRHTFWPDFSFPVAAAASCDSIPESLRGSEGRTATVAY